MIRRNLLVREQPTAGAAYQVGNVLLVQEVPARIGRKNRVVQSRRA